MFTEIADGEIVKTVSIEGKSVETVNGEDVSSWGTIIASLNSLLWDSTNTEQYLSGKFKDSVDNILFVESLTGITKDMRVVDGSTRFSIVHIEDVADQSEAGLLYLKEFTK